MRGKWLVNQILLWQENRVHFSWNLVWTLQCETTWDVLTGFS